MKKIIAMLLVICTLTVCLAGCGTNDVRGEISTDETNETVTEENNDAEENTETENTDAANDEEPLTLGTSSGSKYENTYFGIGCELEGWTFKTDDEIAETNGFARDLMDEDLAKQLETAAIITDMMATSADSYQNVNVTIENLSLIQTVALDEQAYAEASMEGSKAALESMGLENVETTIVEAKIGNETHPAVRITSEVQGVGQYQLGVIVKKGVHVAVITATTVMTDETESVINSFYTI